MSRKDFRRPRYVAGGPDPHKHETPREREARHKRAADAVKTKHAAPIPPVQPPRVRQPLGAVTYTEWDAMHREAEAATLFNPTHRDGKRKGVDGWAAGGGI